MKTKVLHVVHDFLFGGIEAFLFYLTSIQKEESNLDVAILCLQDEGKILNKRILKTGIQIYFVSIKPFDFRISNYYRALKLTNKFDIIHIHSFKPIICEALSFSKAKIVYTNHSSGDFARPTTLNHKVKNHLLVRFLNKHVDLITNNSSYTKKYWVKRGVRKHLNLVIYNGVKFPTEINTNRPIQEFPELKGKFIIGTSSRFIPWKRVELLIEVFDILKKDKKDVCLLLVGDGPEKEKLVQKVNSTNKASNIIFTGLKKNVQDYQSIFDVSVFPSHSEPFGLVAIECLNLNKPVLVMKDGGGIAEILELFNPEFIATDKTDLLAKLNKLYYNRTDLANFESSPFAAKFEMSNIMKEFSNAYNSLVN